MVSRAGGGKAPSGDLAHATREILRSADREASAPVRRQVTRSNHQSCAQYAGPGRTAARGDTRSALSGGPTPPGTTSAGATVVSQGLV